MVRLLFVDDDERAHTTLAMVLPREYRLVSVTSLAAARPLLEAGGINAVLLDIHLPDGSGLDLLRQIQAVSPPPPTVMLSASDDVPTVVEAMRRGAADYLVKPYQLDALLATLATTIANSAARHAAQAEDSDETDALPGRLAGDSAPMSEVRATVGMYATADAPVLVTGESGTGKELVAHLIHQCSHRRERPFIAVNAAALPESLVESELFGSVEGAFTGAITRPGCFEQADGGTLFLDEVGEMALAAQAKLLRVIESKEVTRVGARAATQVNVRMVSATNRQPAAAVAEGRLREDLYYRLGVLPVQLPPLRDRRDDIPTVAYSLLEDMHTHQARQIGIHADAIARLQEHTWPGNVRVLRNVLERARIRVESRHTERQGEAGAALIRAADVVW